MVADLIKKALKIIKERGFRVFIEEILEIVLIPYATIKLRYNLARINSPELLTDFIFRFKIGPLTVRPIQLKEEILELIKIVKKKNPDTFLEIGIAEGGTLLFFSRFAAQNATIIGIDFPGAAEKIQLYRSFAKPEQKFHLIFADSHNAGTLKNVKNILKGRCVDFIFIDGDHSYKGVKRDFEMYSTLVRKGGIIAFHDINTGRSSDGVPVLWKEIKKKYRKKYRYKEIIKIQKGKGHGIGVLFA